MLSKLYIRNYTIIDEICIEPDAALTVITGETGAGKSVLLGALSLLTGKRAEAGLINDPASKCIIEANFNIKAYSFKNLFEEADLDYDDECIIRREIMANGKSRAFINDTPVTLDTLKLIGKELIDVHKQFDTQTLRTEQFQLLLLDSIANHSPLLHQYANQFQAFKSLQHQINELKARNLEALQKKDYLTFQLNELDQADLQDENELINLEKEIELLKHAVEIQASFESAINMLDEAEPSASKLLIESLQQLEVFTMIDDDFKNFAGRLDSLQIELSDLVYELRKKLDQTETNPKRLELLEDRFNLLNRLLNKHQQNDLKGLIEIKSKFTQALESINHSGKQIAVLEKQIEKAKARLKDMAATISSNRIKAGKQLTAYVNRMLPDAAIPEGQFSVVFDTLDKPGMQGMDIIRFLFSANKGKTLQELGKIASGGELSRLMLILKSMVASHTALPSLVFDEIDSGISGEAGIKISRILKQLSKNHQVICITHLPQIAGKGDQHIYIYKELADGKTVAKAKRLTQNERIEEIAEMLSGKNISNASIENAKALMQA